MSAVEVEQIVAEFTDATNRQDVDEMLALDSDDVVFEGTTPPDGVRIEGDKASLRALWEGIFRNSPRAAVQIEELIVCGDGCTALKRYVFDAEHPNQAHVRAVDVIRVEGAKIT